MKHKLLFLINSLEGGGAERVIVNLARHFYQQGSAVTIICLNKGAQAYTLPQGIKIITLIDRKGSETLIRRVQYVLLTLFRLAQVIWSEKPTSVISFMTSVNIYAGLTCNLLRVPYIVSERASPKESVNKLSRHLQRLYARICRKAHAVVVPSYGVADCFRKNTLFKDIDKFRVIRNPINIFKSPSDQPVHPRKFIFSAGRIDYMKGFDLLIEAYSTLGLEDIDVLISGQGPYEAALQKQISKLGLENRVHLIGFQNNLQDYYSQAEAFVLASRTEGYPNVLVEAMSHGCSCIATDCEFGPSEIIEQGKNGILVEVDNVKKLADAINRTIKNPELRKQMSINALEVNHTNSMENISESWKQVILNHV